MFYWTKTAILCCRNNEKGLLKMKKFLLRFNLVLWLLISVFNYADAAKVSTYPSATSLNNADYWPIIQSGANKNINWENIQQLSGFDAVTTFNVKQYNAKGDGVTKYDGTITSGTPNFTSATGSFTSADVGKVITIIGAGGSNVDLTTTISAYVSATAVTLTANASATVSGVQYTYGTDDTTAFNDVITAVFARSPIGGKVFIPEGIYIINGAFNKANQSQIGLPTLINTDTTARQSSITFEGSFDPKNGSYYKKNWSGSIIYSTKQGVSGDSIISGKNASASGNFTDLQVIFRNLTFRTVQNPVNSAINMQYVNASMGENLLIDTAGLLFSEMIQPTTSGSYGLITPDDLNNGTSSWRNIRTRGFYGGVRLGEHGKLHDSILLYHVNAVVIPTMTHSAYMGYVGMEGNVNNVVCGGSGGNVTIEHADIEHNSTQGWPNVTDILDASSLCTGFMRYDITAAGGGSSSFSVSGAKGWTVVAVDGQGREFRSTGTQGAFFVNYAANSTTGGSLVTVIQDADTAVTSGSRLGGIGYAGAYGANRQRVFGATITGFADENFTSSASGTHIRFNTAPTGSSTPVERMRLTNGGNLGIGSTNPGATLDVTGTIRASSGTAGQATCWKADKTLGQCTSVVGAGGACTCS